MSTRVACFAVAIAVAVAPTDAVADDSTDSVVAVLPLVTSSTDLEIYSGPVAREVVARLGKKLSMRVEAVKPSGTIPDRVTLVVDGRIVKRGKNKVMLTATVRDPSRGTRAGTVSTRVGAVTEIDKLAADLAAKLSPLIAKAAARPQVEDRAEPVDPDVEPVRDLSGDSSSTGGTSAGGDAEPQRRQSASDERPIVLVVPPNGTVAATVKVGPPAYTPMAAAIRRLGFATVRSTRSGIVGPQDVVTEVAGANAEFALMIQLKKVEFDWRGVLSARGKVRVLLVGRDGKPRYDRTVRTDTLVGSRGDRHAALVGFVAEQAIDIAYPALRKAMR